MTLRAAFAALCLFTYALAGAASPAFRWHPVSPNGDPMYQIYCTKGTVTTAPLDTAENVLMTCPIPANSVGAEGRMRIQFLIGTTQSLDNKTITVKYGGTQLIQYLVSDAVVGAKVGIHTIDVANQNDTSLQRVTAQQISNWSLDPYVQFTAVSTAATANAGDLTVACTKADGTEKCELTGGFVEIAYETPNPGFTAHPVFGPNVPRPVQIPCLQSVPATVGAVTTETTLFTCTLGAGQIGANGYVRITTNWDTAASIANRTIRVRLNGTYLFSDSLLATTNTSQFGWQTFNRNNEASQASTVYRCAGALCAMVAPVLDANFPFVTSIDTASNPAVFTATCQKANASDNCTLSSAILELMYAP